MFYIHLLFLPYIYVAIYIQTKTAVTGYSGRQPDGKHAQRAYGSDLKRWVDHLLGQKVPPSKSCLFESVCIVEDELVFLQNETVGGYLFYKKGIGERKGLPVSYAFAFQDQRIF